MTSSSRNFRLNVDHLEDRLVPSGLDPDFFNQLQFQYMEDATAAEERTVRVVTALYQESNEMVSDQYQELEQGKVDAQNQLMQNLTNILMQNEQFKAAVEQRVNEIFKQYGIDVEGLRSTAQNAISNSAGMAPEAQQQQTGTILSWTAKQYEDLTAGVTRQYNEVMFQYQHLQQNLQVQYAGAIEEARRLFGALSEAQNNLLNAYSNYQVQLVDYYTQQVKAIRDQLTAALLALQAAYANQTEIASPSYDFGYYQSGYYNSDYSGGGYSFCDECPKGN